MERILLIAAALMFDLLFGDPYWLYHPVRMIGTAISGITKQMKKICRRDRGVHAKREIAAGGVLAFVVIIGTYGITAGILYAAARIHEVFGIVLAVFWAYQILAAKCLKTETDKVWTDLMHGDLKKARISISYLVGRDTGSLSEEEVAKACVETIAENTTDGVIAPLFYLFIGGVPLGMAYKAVNTLDSMVGYRNEEFEYLGKISAKIDDIANYIPARLAAWAMLAVGVCLRFDWKNAWKTYLADRKAHLSPNCGQTESVAAGALRVQLGGTHDYFGKSVVKPAIGQALERCSYEKIKDVQKLMVGSLLICMAVFSFVFFGISRFL